MGNPFIEKLLESALSQEYDQQAESCDIHINNVESDEDKYICVNLRTQALSILDKEEIYEQLQLGKIDKKCQILPLDAFLKESIPVGSLKPPLLAPSPPPLEQSVAAAAAAAAITLPTTTMTVAAIANTNITEGDTNYNIYNERNKKIDMKMVNAAAKTTTTTMKTTRVLISASTTSSSGDVLSPKAGEMNKHCIFDKLNVLSPEIQTLHMSEKIWYYHDFYGNHQGPFSKERILTWWEAGYMLISTCMFPKKIKEQHKYDFYIKLGNLLATWFYTCDNWQYKDPNDIIHGPYSKTVMLQWFTTGKLPSDLPVRPLKWSNIPNGEFLPFLYYAVLWLPPSNYWILKAENNPHEKIVTLFDVGKTWMEEYSGLPKKLYARPITWDYPSLFVPVEVLMEAYGYLFFDNDIIS